MRRVLFISDRHVADCNSAVGVHVFASQNDLDESASALKSAVEQAKRSANDVTRMSDELRQEQDRNAALEKQRRLHETQIKELQVGPMEFLHFVFR